MAWIEPVRQDVQHPGLIKKNSFHLRLWHWLNVIVISGSLITVLIHSTLLENHEPTGGAGQPAATQAAIAGQTVHDLGEKVWQVHIYFGLTLVALLLYRFGFEFFQRSGQKFFTKLNAAFMRYRHVPEEKTLARHEAVVKALYLAFYVLLLIMAVTGLLLVFRKNLGISKAVGHQIREVHGFCMYLVIAFIVVHVTGVVLAERKESPGIISDMVNGGRSEDPQLQEE